MAQFGGYWYPPKTDDREEFRRGIGSTTGGSTNKEQRKRQSKGETRMTLHRSCFPPSNGLSLDAEAGWNSREARKRSAFVKCLASRTQRGGVQGMAGQPTRKSALAESRSQNGYPKYFGHLFCFDEEQGRASDTWTQIRSTGEDERLGDQKKRMRVFCYGAHRIKAEGGQANLTRE